MPSNIPSKLIVDFTNTKEQSGFNPVHQPAGDYRGIIKSVEYGKSKQNNNDMLTYAVADVDRPSAAYRYNCTLTEASLWKLRNILVAAGINVPKKKVNIASVAAKIVGKEIGMSLDDDEYEGKMRSQIVTVFSADDLPEDEPAPVAKKKAKPAAKPAADEEDVEDDTDDDEEEDLDELDIDDL
jgi:hypothetical protein